MWCPIHRCVLVDEECPKCNEQGIITIEEEFDKQNRTFDTMTCLGYRFQPQRSYVVMVFSKPK